MTVDVTATVVNKLTGYCEQNNVVIVIDVSTAISQLDMDSLALMEIVYELEEELAIMLEPASLSGLNTVGDLIAVVNRARKNAA